VKIYKVDKGDPRPPTFPSITLLPDHWDDFGFKTTFYVAFWRSPENAETLHQIKIMKIGLKRGTPVLPKAPLIDSLPDNFASIGADFGYYTRIMLLGPELQKEILTAMRDLATDEKRFKRFKNEVALEESLFRLAPARDAFNQMRAVSHLRPIDLAGVFEPASDTLPEANVKSINIDANTEIEFQTTLNQTALEGPLRVEFTPARNKNIIDPLPIVFDFAGPAKLPNRMIAVVGPNGTGKTTLLSELALAIFFGKDNNRGLVSTPSGSVSQVLFVSYSAYDNFEIPDKQKLSDDAQKQLADRGYVYIGLRELGAGKSKKNYLLKSPQSIDQEFSDSLQEIKKGGEKRVSIFLSAMATLLADPSFSTIVKLGPRAKVETRFKRLRSIFPRLSTGHKAAMNIVAGLSARLNRNGLVFLDEPEAHLHPPLVATLLRVIRILLTAFEANAITATHSPVVVQETLGIHVLKFNRVDDCTNWQKHTGQTFGENLAALTRNAFGLPAERADFISVLDGLVKENLTLDEIEEIFGEDGMSSPARAQVFRLTAQRLSNQK